MGKRLRLVMITTLIGFLAGSCHDHHSRAPADDPPPGTVAMVFRIELNRQVYQDSAWGDPPQLAVWLVDETDASVRTVAVTHRTGAGDWEGKVECSVALPYWVTCYNRETNTDGPPTWDRPAVDAVTCATPRAALNVSVDVPRRTQWTYFVEVNVSGDYSVHFPSLSEAGISDRYGNGQPSIIYRGAIEAREGAASRPKLWGRTDQYAPVETASTDLEPITTARELLRSITVVCKPVAGLLPGANRSESRD